MVTQCIGLIQRKGGHKFGQVFDRKIDPSPFQCPQQVTNRGEHNGVEHGLGDHGLQGVCKILKNNDHRATRVTELVLKLS